MRGLHTIGPWAQQNTKKQMREKSRSGEKVQKKITREEEEIFNGGEGEGKLLNPLDRQKEGKGPKEGEKRKWRKEKAHGSNCQTDGERGGKKGGSR